MTHNIPLKSLLASLSLALNVSFAAQPIVTNTIDSLESIRKKRDLPALAVVVVKNSKICDRAATGVRKGLHDSEFGLAQSEESAEPQVKIRCQRCRALNDEPAKFCNQCGTAL